MAARVGVVAVAVVVAVVVVAMLPGVAVQWN